MSNGESGPVALISQNSDYTNIVTRQASDLGIQFNRIINCGKADDMDEADLLESLSKDPGVKIITAYIENVKDRARFFKLLLEVTKTKPVIIWKDELAPGVSGTATSSNSSVEEKQRPQHSECQFCRDGRCTNKASMFYNEVRELDAQVCSVFRRRDVEPEKELDWDSVFRQSRTIKVKDSDELVDTTLAFLYLAPHRGMRVSVVGSGEGVTMATTNASERIGLTVPPFSTELQDKLALLIPTTGAFVRNPVDVGSLLSSPDTLKAVLETVLTESSVDTVIINVSQTTSANSELSRLVVNARKRWGKPVVIVLPTKSAAAGTTEFETAWRNTRDYYLGARIPVYPTPERAAKALVNLVHYYEHRDS